jgi:hypothetical protein
MLKILKNKFFSAGITSVILSVLRQLNNLKKGDLLYIDIENISYSNKKNFWDQYFEQPFHLENKKIRQLINKKKFSIISWNTGPKLKYGYGERSENKYLCNVQNISYLRNVFKKHIIIKKKIIEKFQIFIKKKITNKNVLSIHIRGTDQFTTGHAAGQKKLDYETFIKPLVIKKLKEKKCSKIFLATDESEIYLKFKKDFSKILIKNSTVLAKHNSIQSIHIQNVYESERLKFKITTDVLGDIIIMSKCKYSLCMKSGVSLINILMKKKYNYEFIDDEIDYNRMK